MSRHGTKLPARKRTYRVALTPLADAMFQLLMFFMLTTSLTPYSLITLRDAAEGAEEQAEQSAEPQGAVDETSQAPAAPPPSAAGRTTIWTIGDGVITTGGQVFEREQIADLAEALGGADADASVLLVLTGAARMQDLASAMEALRGAAVDNVQITNDGA